MEKLTPLTPLTPESHSEAYKGIEWKLGVNPVKGVNNENHGKKTKNKNKKTMPFSKEWGNMCSYR